MNLLNSPAYLRLQKYNALFVKVMWIDKVNKMDVEQVSVLYWKTVWSALSSSLVHDAMTDVQTRGTNISSSSVMVIVTLG